MSQELKSLRYRARNLYKELRYLGHSYPDPSYNFNARLRKCFAASSSPEVQGDVEKLRKQVEKAEFVKKEVEALYFLKRYRTLKRRYDS
ncbi:hypothetical protein BT69DRAFT_1285574 [Atractiella rhizophila]|nr:hypothetical protein BT69DRAFT_1285574 [Atractiella rhizophila]